MYGKCIIIYECIKMYTGYVVAFINNNFNWSSFAISVARVSRAMFTTESNVRNIEVALNSNLGKSSCFSEFCRSRLFISKKSD